MLLTGISYAPAKNYSSRQLKNNSSNQTRKDNTQAKSNFGLYNLSSRYGISFGNKIHSNEPTIKEGHEGDTSYTPKKIADILNECIERAHLYHIRPGWPEKTANRIAGLGLSNELLNNFFYGIERMAEDNYWCYGIYDACNCITPDNEEIVKKLLNATYKSNDKNLPTVFPHYLNAIIDASEGKEDILDIILSAKVSFKNGNECPLVDSGDISMILKASTPENKEFLEDYLKKASEDKERNSDCSPLRPKEATELFYKLKMYGEYTPEKIAGILNKCIERAHLYRIPEGWIEKTADRIAGLGLSNESLYNFFEGIERMAEDNYWSYGIYDACECINNSDNEEIVKKLLSATLKSEGRNLPAIFPYYLKEIINASKGKEDILDIILSAKLVVKNGFECPIIYSSDISEVLKACTPENKGFLEDYLKKASEDKERHFMLDSPEINELIDGLKAYTESNL